MTSPIPVFLHRFKVHVDGITSDDSSAEFFSSVTGLSKGVGKSISLGYISGNNASAFLPEGYDTKIIVITRPLMSQASSISKWCEDPIHTMNYTPRSLYVFVLNLRGDIEAQWTAYNSIPIAVDISTMDISSGNTLIVQSISIKAEKITMDKPICK